MVEIKYELGRMSIVVSDSDIAPHPKRAVYFVSAHRRGDAAFVATHSLAWCDTLDSAQALARMLIGIEITDAGAAIWPDGRTGSASGSGSGSTPTPTPTPTPNAAHEHSAAQSRELYKARALLKRSVDWSVLMGGWDASVWAEARAFLWSDTAAEPSLRPDELGD